jgi:hypothetical protein
MPSPHPTDRTRRLFWWGLALPIILIVLALYQLTGCQSNPLTVAQDPLQKAYALYGEFVIVEEQAAALRANGTLAGTSLATVQRLDAKAKPSADALLKAVLDYESIAAQVKTGTSSADKLNLAKANVQSWVNTATNDITALVNAVKGQ